MHRLLSLLLLPALLMPADSLTTTQAPAAPAPLATSNPAEIDASQRGVILDGRDVTVALQALVADPATRGYTICLPPGTGRLSATVTAPAWCRLRGAGKDVTNLGGRLAGAPLYVAGIRTQGIGFFNADPAGIGMDLEGVQDALIEDCAFKGHRGLIVGATSPTTTGLTIRDCLWPGDAGAFPQGVGACIHAQGAIYGGRVTRWGAVGLRLAHEMSVYETRFEINALGLQCAREASDGDGPWRGLIAHATFESNDTAVEVNKLALYSRFSSVSIRGNANGSTYGLNVAGGHELIFDGLAIDGRFSQHALRLHPNPGGTVAMETPWYAMNGGVPDVFYDGMQPAQLLVMVFPQQLVQPSAPGPAIPSPTKPPLKRYRAPY